MEMNSFYDKVQHDSKDVDIVHWCLITFFRTSQEYGDGFPNWYYVGYTK